MNLRKFYFILTIVLVSVLFCSGIGVLYYVNSQIINTSSDGTASDSPIKDIFTPFIPSKEPFNILLLGGDKVNKNSDTMMLANFDPVTCKVNIMSIPRDTKVIIENKTRKINYAFPHGGVDLTVQTVSELLDVNIKYYVFVDTSAFRDIIDLLGGVNYYVPVDLNYDDPTQNLHIHLKQGQQTLNGTQSEHYIRFRKPNKWTSEVKKYYDGSDIMRTEVQQAFLKELMRQKLNLQNLPKLNSIISVVFQNLETNLSLNEVIKMTGYISKFKVENVNFIPMPGKPYDATPWYYLCDIDSARQICMESFIGTSSYLMIDNASKEAYKNIMEDLDNNTKTTSSKSTTKNNPSNAESSIKGTDKADP
jgi:polyisoprenyl-teichoic acid--peptidoglycan teichoic acid transferase